MLAPDAKLPVVALLPPLVHGESASVAQRAPRDDDENPRAVFCCAEARTDARFAKRDRRGT